MRTRAGIRESIHTPTLYLRFLLTVSVRCRELPQLRIASARHDPIIHVLYDTTTPSARRCLSCHRLDTTFATRLPHHRSPSCQHRQKKKKKKTHIIRRRSLPQPTITLPRQFRPHIHPQAVAAGKFAYISHLTLDAPTRHRTRISSSSSFSTFDRHSFAPDPPAIPL